MPRLFRQSPLNAIWEGSGNVICLDVLRAMQREPGSLEALVGELAGFRGLDARLTSAIDTLLGDLTSIDPCTDPEGVQVRARGYVDRMALCLQGGLMAPFGDTDTAEAFCASRLEPAQGVGVYNYGAGFADGVALGQLRRVVERTTPVAR